MLTWYSRKSTREPSRETLCGFRHPIFRKGVYLKVANRPNFLLNLLKQSMEERLQKILARAYGISRRNAETLITEGKVSVNGRPAILGTKVNPLVDSISVEGKPIAIQKLNPAVSQEIWMFNKPRGVVCTHAGPYEFNTLQRFIPRPLSKQKWLFVGRLDKDSEGLLLLTNDGALAHKISHPSFNIPKKYRIHLQRPFDTCQIPNLLKGITEDGEKLSLANLYLVGSRKLDVVLLQGKKREIRRLFAAFGYEVLKLKRLQIGGLTLPKTLLPGQSKRLSLNEINLIFNTKS